jgi:hypothetical protein
MGTCGGVEKNREDNQPNKTKLPTTTDLNIKIQ